MYLLGTLATLPSATSTIAQIGAWSSPWFDELLPFAILAVGITVGVFLLWFLVGLFHRATGR